MIPISAAIYCLRCRILARYRWLLFGICRKESVLPHRRYHSVASCRAPIYVARVHDDLIHVGRTAGPVHW
jgi:hypothetical protein